MKKLIEQKCVPCHGDSKLLSDREITTLQPQVSEWQIITVDNERQLQRSYKFANFKLALAFTQQVGEEAEKEGHHPSLLCEWGKVTVTWWTHAIHGLHQNDFIMAVKTDSIYENYR